MGDKATIREIISKVDTDKGRETKVAYSYITTKFKQTTSRESGAIVQSKI